MKSKGIVKIDEVGRLVIPKEIRNMLNLKDKLVEAYVENDRLIIRRYAPLRFCHQLLKDLCGKVGELSGYVCFAGDLNCITEVSSSLLSFLKDKPTSYPLKQKLKEGQAVNINASEGVVLIPLTDGEEFEYYSLCLLPLNDESTCVGFFGLISLDQTSNFGENEIYLLKVAKELFLSALKHEKNK